MSSILANNVIFPGQYNNYVVGGNVCNGFAIGNIGSTEDFFIIASEPEDESNYPMITGNFLDSEGNVLFRLVENSLVINPGKCQKILGDHIGYEIVDSSGVTIFKIETKFEQLPAISEECFITTIDGNFFNSKGELVAEAGKNSNITLSPEAKAVIGLGVGSSFGIVQNYQNSELDLMRVMIGTKGKIHKILSGEINKEKVILDGCLMTNLSLNGCEIEVITGEFVLGDNVSIIECGLKFLGPAGQVRGLVEAVTATAKTE